MNTIITKVMMDRTIIKLRHFAQTAMPSEVKKLNKRIAFMAMSSLQKIR